MRPEIEAKFLAVDQQDLRKRLKDQNAKLVKPMRLMKRAILDFPKNKVGVEKLDGWVRVRDEGDGYITAAFKRTSDEEGGGYSHEVEVVVNDFTAMVEIFENIGLKIVAIQESRRETWKLGNVEVVLDEWPWVKPYIEIEGPTEASIRDVSARLGLPWSQAIFGSVDIVYAAEYPGIRIPDDHVSQMKEMSFGKPIPDWLKERQNP